MFDGVLEQAFGLGLEGASFITAYPQRDALRSAAAIKAGSRLDEQTARLVAVRDGVKLVLAGSRQSVGVVGLRDVGTAIDAADGKDVADRGRNGDRQELGVGRSGRDGDEHAPGARRSRGGPRR